MNNFDIAMVFVGPHEGIDSDHVNDAGGVTRFGISLRFLKLTGEDIDGDGHVTADDIKALSVSQAHDLYRKYFWEHYRLNEIQHPFIAAKIMDMFVNMRGKTAAKAVQRCFGNLVDDGILGSQSLGVINAEKTPGYLYNLLGAEQAAVYKRIIANNPTQKDFEKGWLRRAAQ